MSQVKQAQMTAGAVVLLVVRESIRSFSRNRNLESAATLAYYGFLSLMPLLLLLIFLLGWIAESSDTALAAIQGLLADLFPAFDERLLAELGTLAHQRVWGVVGFAVLLWSMTPFAGAARHTIVHIFKGEHRPAFLREKSVDLAVVLALLLLFILLTAGRLVAPSLQEELAWVARAARAAVGLAVAMGMVSVFYKVFAPVKLQWREAAVGALVAVFLLGLIRPLFGLLLQYNPNFGYAFGSVKAIFLLIVWVYYTFAVLLFGAELAANTRRREALVLRGFLAGDRPVGRTSQRLVERFVRRFDRGSVLFREGDAGDEMYFIRSGAVRLTRGPVELRVMREGDYFGEMSMLLGAPRTATAEVTESDTELVAIAEHNLETILLENPGVVRRLLVDMAARLQAMNERIDAAGRK
ncbi:MAG TPA: YhjD/YihY/BrkB family envelope integrity protein [Kiritimatiellia bacterium]|nr:YhjD/YihY/BrkB family envelope integrity protein [Kiritimatiellia bacterium]